MARPPLSKETSALLDGLLANKPGLSRRQIEEIRAAASVGSLPLSLAPPVQRVRKNLRAGCTPLPRVGLGPSRPPPMPRPRGRKHQGDCDPAERELFHGGPSVDREAEKDRFITIRARAGKSASQLEAENAVRVKPRPRAADLTPDGVEEAIMEEIRLIGRERAAFAAAKPEVDIDYARMSRVRREPAQLEGSSNT